MTQRDIMEKDTILYREYIKELRVYAPEWLEPETFPIWEGTVKEYLSDPFSEWIHIKEQGSNEDIGFVIIARQGGDCHPDANFTIAQSFVKKEYRNKGYMTEAIVKFAKKHKGIYCYDVLKGNNLADLFWETLFTEKLNAKRVYLPEVRGIMERKYLNLYGYRVK